MRVAYMNSQTSSLANVCMAAQLRLAIALVPREGQKQIAGEKKEIAVLCHTMPRHAMADSSMTTYLQRSKGEGTRLECRCERGIAYEDSLCNPLLNLPRHLSLSLSVFESSLTSQFPSFVILSVPSSRSKRQLKHLGNS